MPVGTVTNLSKARRVRVLSQTRLSLLAASPQRRLRLTLEHPGDLPAQSFSQAPIYAAFFSAFLAFFNLPR